MSLHGGLRAKRQFDVVLIDFYGTIAAGDREAVEAACRTIVQACRLPVSAAEFAIAWGERYFEVVGESNHAAFRTLYECELSSLRDMLARFGIDADPAPFVAQLEAYWRDPPIHADAVDFLSILDVPVCCVSNADSAPLQTAIAKHNLRFDAIIASEAVRCYKPDPEIFRHALRQMGASAARTLHIGDSLHSDISGASKVGITTAWICRETRIHDIGESKPHHTVASLGELHAFLT
ncbi:MAG: HAD family hydrolase [Planctomycetota bacterium]